MNQFEAKKLDALLVVSKVPNPQQFGVAVLEGSRIVRLVEKPRDYISSYALVGIYLFTPKPTAVFATGSIFSWRVRVDGCHPVDNKWKQRKRSHHGVPGGVTQGKSRMTFSYATGMSLEE